MCDLGQCPQCGGTPEDTEWNSCFEFSWGMEQTCSVVCHRCCFGVSLVIDPEKLSEGDPERIEKRLRQAWNTFVDDLG